jgi:phage tail-like protein
MRFHVTTNFSDASLNIDTFGANVPAGFMSVTTPEATTEAVEYREGTYNYARKFPGTTTVSDVSLQKGVVPGYSTFWAWLRIIIEGEGDYRCDMTIKHFNRSVLTQQALTGSNRATFGSSMATFDPGATATREYVLYNAFATRHKVAGDMDASSSDISIQEIDVAYENFDVIENGAQPTGTRRSV